MQIDLSKKEFRRLLDMVYIGNWILNSTRGDDRFADYDDLESSLFALCREQGMDTLVERYEGTDVPSRAFSDGGIHEAIMDYEDTVFYEILAEELARRDMEYQPVSNDNYEELVSRMDDYIAEFEAHGTDNILISDMDQHNRKRQCRIGHWRFYVSALSGGAPVWVCAERLQGADRLSGGQGDGIDIQTVRLTGNVRADGEDQGQGRIIAAIALLCAAAHVRRAEASRVDIVQTGLVDPPRVAAGQIEAWRRCRRRRRSTRARFSPCAACRSPRGCGRRRDCYRARKSAK